MSFYATKTLRKSMLATTTFTMSNTIAQYPVSGLWDIDLFVTALLLELIRQHFFGSVVKFVVCRLFVMALNQFLEPFHGLFLNHLAQAVIVDDANLSQSQKHRRPLKSKIMWNGWFHVEDDLSFVLKNIVVVFCWCWKWTLFDFLFDVLKNYTDE